MIENVLDFSRIEQGRKQYEFEPTDLVRLVQETVKLMEPYAAERRVTLSLALPDPQPSRVPPQPIMDGQAIQQALVNLIDNAIKHSPDGSTVTVGLDFTSPELGAGDAPRPTSHAPPLRLGWKTPAPVSHQRNTSVSSNGSTGSGPNYAAKLREWALV